MFNIKVALSSLVLCFLPLDSCSFQTSCFELGINKNIRGVVNQKRFTSPLTKSEKNDVSMLFNLKKEKKAHAVKRELRGHQFSDRVTYTDRSGERLSFPQAERYTSNDWLHNLFTIPTSIILGRIKKPIFWEMVWASGIVILNKFIPINVSMKPHTLLGSALGLLLVFRTNAAYNRFWEGRRIWEKLLAQSRDMSRMAMIYSDTIGRKSVLRIAKLLCAFPHVLQEHLQACKKLPSYQHILEEDDLKTLLITTCNRPLLIVNKLAKEIVNIKYDDNWTSRERLAMLSMVNKLSECIGKCERLIQTPVPLHYVRHTSRFLTLWCFMLPVILVSEMGWLTIPISGMSTWALFGIQEIGLLIEEPFSRSLLLDVFAETVNADVMQTIEAKFPPKQQSAVPNLEEEAYTEEVF